MYIGYGRDLTMALDTTSQRVAIMTSECDNCWRNDTNAPREYNSTLRVQQGLAAVSNTVSTTVANETSLARLHGREAVD